MSSFNASKCFRDFLLHALKLFGAQVGEIKNKLAKALINLSIERLKQN
jgi:hypothetical protein